MNQRSPYLVTLDVTTVRLSVAFWSSGYIEPAFPKIQNWHFIVSKNSEQKLKS